MAPLAENKRAIVVVTRRLPTPVEDRLASLFEARLSPDDEPLSTAALRDAVGTADVLACTVGDPITKEVIEAAGPQLKLIANFGVGVNHIDLEAASAKGILVSNTPDVLTEDTADLALALILMASRGLASGERILRAGGWDGWSPTSMMAGRVNGKKLGVIGMGRIGIAVARRARGFNMEIHYNNRRPVEAAIAEELCAVFWEDLDAMLGAVDVVSVNCPQTEDTFHLLSAERLALLQPHAILVNTARGGIIDEGAMVTALKAGQFAAAGLDVFEAEPVVHPELIDMENVVLLPHLGSATHEGRIAMGEKVIENIEAFLAGQPLPDGIS